MSTRFPGPTPQISSIASKPRFAAPLKVPPRSSPRTDGPGHSSARSPTKTRSRRSHTTPTTSCTPLQPTPASSRSSSPSHRAGLGTPKTFPPPRRLSHSHTSNRTRPLPNVPHLRECACSADKSSSYTAEIRPSLSNARDAIQWSTLPGNVQYLKAKYGVLSATAIIQ